VECPSAGACSIFAFPTILDDYVLRGFALYFAMIVAAFLMLLLVFTLFELLSDILRNQISPLTVGEYLLNVAPYFLYTHHAAQHAAGGVSHLRTAAALQ
jgi:hypothetical protein